MRCSIERALMAKYLVRAMLAAQRWPLLPGEALRDIHNALLAVPHEPHDFVTVCIASVDARSGLEALKKIEEKSFGVCEECGGKISQERLEAIPTATLCISCKTKRDAK